MANLEVSKGLVAQKNTKVPQYIQVSLTTADIHSGVAVLKWYNVQNNGTIAEPFATANLFFGSSNQWLDSWIPVTHLIQGRIETLEKLAAEGVANRFSRTMAYTLFASNLVDYADKYRGMQSVVLHQLEAFADVKLTEEKSGTWTVPPYFIDSVAHLAGFIMNVSDAIDTKKDFSVTPGWSSMRFAKPLIAGSRYRSYVRMIPTLEDPNVYLGDVYILQDDVIIGMVGGIKFRRYPRLLLNRFFSAPDEAGTAATALAPVPGISTPVVTVVAEPPKPDRAPEIQQALSPAPAPVANPIESDSTAAKAMLLVANEAGLELDDLKDEASFASLGIDSLMSLVIAEKFREELGITVGGSLFLEYPTVGDLRAWLLEYYS